MIRKSGLYAFALWFFVISQAWAQEGKEPANLNQTKCTMQMDLTGPIGVASLDNFERAMSKAQSEQCSSMLVMINTPGGSLQTTRLIVEKILNSPIPILCLVYPSGAHAGSAGAIILQACHVSGAMVATNIGAATPISSTGKEIPEDLRKKLLNDTTSWLEGIVKMRERSLDFARDIIVDAKAVDAKEALKLGAIEFVAEKPNEFLDFARGRTVQLSAGQKTMVEVGPIIHFKEDLRSQLLSLIADPEIAYLMFMGSLGLIYFELTHPGTIVPGVIGGIGLVLSLVSLHKLNVTWGALALLVLGLLLMIAEAFVPSFGALGIGGIASFVLGSLFLFDPEVTGYSLPLTLILPTVIFLGLLMFGLAVLAFRTRHVKTRATYDVLVGKSAKVVELAGGQDGREGWVEIHGETWRFQSEVPLVVNDVVNVNNHKGFTLIVEKSQNKKEGEVK